MFSQIAAVFRICNARLGAGLRTPQIVAFLPALMLAAFWLGGELMLFGTALGFTLLYALNVDLRARQQNTPRSNTDMITSKALSAHAEYYLDLARDQGVPSACFLIEVEGIDHAEQHHGQEHAETLRSYTLSRLRSVLRGSDAAWRLGDSRYAVLVSPASGLDLDRLLAMGQRIQTALETALEHEKCTHHLMVSIGFASTAKLGIGDTAAHWINLSDVALRDATGNGPSAIRAYSKSMGVAKIVQSEIREELDHALNSGQIQPWFQPQLCTSTGRITGVEALARWVHPKKGIVPPSDFLPHFELNGQMDRLNEVILSHSLTALRTWDQAGLDVPRVSVNFSSAELRNPDLVERIGWELDRFGVPPERLGVEILETVISDAPQGVEASNIIQLSEMGCFIDLDDFGTGHASISALRRFSVHRLKIDRSLVTAIDLNADQRRMLDAVLSLAERLGLQTLAEGVESVGEHTLLAQLGCDHVQGFGIARPMAVNTFVEWYHDHGTRIAQAERLGRSAG